MAQKQTAIVVVKKQWVNDLRHLLHDGHESRSTDDVHLLIGALEDASDLRGLWLKDVPSSILKKDGSAVKMKVLIPWTNVVGCGIVNEDAEKVAAGFQPEARAALLTKSET
jgi:hypothetical protein